MPQHVERADRPVALDRELADPVLTHERLEIRPDAVGALGQHVGLLVQHLVQDHDALVGQADLVRVRIHQAPPHVGGVPILDSCAFSSPPTYCTGLRTLGSSGSRRGQSDSTGMAPEGSQRASFGPKFSRGAR